jgi:aspartate kinase
MKVFKFGGASVKDPEAVKNLCNILKLYSGEKLVVVVSAMGKTTNALEEVAASYYNKDGKAKKLLEKVKKYHYNIMNELFPKDPKVVFDDVNNFFVEAEWVLDEEPSRGYAFSYDQIVPTGELVSTKIISDYLKSEGVKSSWLDARGCIRTDNAYREGEVAWEATEELVTKQVSALLENEDVVITQGFIGCTSENYTTTLGREGSDYTAAIFAYCLDVKEVLIWKDVQGVLNADPKHFPEAQKLDMINYLDAIELAYYGASVIHPKTIKPLQNKNITLHIKSFVNPEAPGTLVGTDNPTKPLIPSVIMKFNQELLSISAKDFSFIAEDNLSSIFGIFAKHSVKMNMMQNSAISFSACIDNDPFKVPDLLKDLNKKFKVLYNENLLLYTIRHYFPSTIESLTTGKEVLVEQRSRHTAQFVVKADDKK